MTEFSKNELLRLVDKIPETDPTTTAYHVLMQSIECYNALALTVDEIIALRDAQVYEDLVEQGRLTDVTEQLKKMAEAAKPTLLDTNAVAPFEVADFPAETPEEQEGHEVAELVKKVVEAQPKKAEEKTYTSPEVRKALVDARGKGVNVKEILAGFGAENFQALPASKYGALMEALEVIG